MDFGIALDESARRLTWSDCRRPSALPTTWAPEQVSGPARRFRTTSTPWELFSFEMLTGELPYSGSNVYPMMKAKTGEDPQPPTHFRPDLDPHLEESSAFDRAASHAIATRPRPRC